MGRIRPKRMPGTYPASESLDSCFSDGAPGPVRNRTVPDRAAVSLIGQERRHRAKDAPVIDATKRWEKTATYR